MQAVYNCMHLAGNLFSQQHIAAVPGIDEELLSNPWVSVILQLQ